ncbi:MAG: IPT/TIG domain-containing protein [Methylococcales bacterium]
MIAVTQTSEAAWLKAYGTPENDAYTSVQHLDQGGYAVSGKTGDANWYSVLDAQGNVLWSKSSGKISVNIDHDGGINLHELRNLSTSGGYDPVSISATGKVDLSNGAISAVSVKKNLSGNSGQLYNIDTSENIIAGNWQTAAGNRDLAFAKLDANNQPLWSHRYDLGAVDSGSVYPLAGGYLLALIDSVIDPVTFDYALVNVLSKLDSNGNIIAGSSKKITDGVNVYYPQQLADGSIILSSTSEKDFTLIKLDANLNFVWAKRYASSNSTDRVHAAFYSRSPAANSELELVNAYRDRVDGTGNIIDRHPLVIKINAGTGEIISKKEVKIRQFDPISFSTEITGKYVLNGSVSNTYSDTTSQKADDDGLFSLFSSGLQEEWVKTITGSAYDRVDSLEKGANSYFISGTTDSWGAGKTDFLLGKLDKSGTVANCSAIQSTTATITEADLVSADVASPLSDAADPKDNGSFAVTENLYALEVNPLDYTITPYDVCSAADPNPAGVISMASEFDFGAVALRQSASLEVTINNSGDAALKITAVSAPAKPFSKSKTGDNCTGSSIASGGSCKINYNFSPTAAGSFTANVTVSSDDPLNSSTSFTLKGSGGSTNNALTVQSLSTTNVGVGSKITISGKGFTSKKGKVLYGKKAATIVSWTDSSIVIKLPTSKAGANLLKVVTKNNGSVNSGQVQLRSPEVTGLNPGTGSKGALVTVNGQYFGISKPKVYLVSGRKRTAVSVKVLTADSSLQIKIPKLKAGDYRVEVSNSAGKSSSQINFTYQ